jgi:hypothetical protein
LGDVFVQATVSGYGSAYPIVRASDLLGAHRTVDTIPERDAIPASHRDEGMTVWITTTGQLFRLVGGITNANWVEAVASDYAGKFETASIGTGDIPNGKWGWWWQTTTSELWLVRNRSNVLYYVEATPGAP